ncbi:MAG: hypothetical protein NTY38_12140 [Acidobacteria bacterium]|nr:hypothetical protein [Acidobacteriota bacterium]
MNWNRSETVGLANPRCTFCQGTGLLLARHGLAPCGCVLRQIFRRCYNRFRDSNLKAASCSQATLEYTAGCDRRFSWGRKDEEYVADFMLVSKRTLTASEYRIFSFHYLLGGDWKLCCRRLGIDRGAFFHDVYRIEEKLGRIFRELQPYGLYPLDDYFFSSSTEMSRRPSALPAHEAPRALKPGQAIPIPGRQAA